MAGRSPSPRVQDLPAPGGDPRCGTLTGHRAHYRRGEKACPACVQASTAYAREWRHKKAKARPRGPFGANPEFEPKPGETLRHLLRRRRYDLGLSQAQVVSRTTLRKRTLERLETGLGVKVWDATLRKLSAALAVDLEYIAQAATVSGLWRVGSPIALGNASNCGTYYGYNLHIRKRTPVCDDCQQARREYRRRQRGQQPRPPGASGYIGVRRRGGGRWQAVVRWREGDLPGFWSHPFNDPEDAARAHDVKALEVHGAKAQLNFPRADVRGMTLDSIILQSREYECAHLPEDVTTVISRYMKDNEITQTELARRMGVTSGRVSRILSGDENPTLRTLGAICASLDVRFQAELVPNLETPKNPGQPPSPEGPEG